MRFYEAPRFYTLCVSLCAALMGIAGNLTVTIAVGMGAIVMALWDIANEIRYKKQ